MSKPIALNLSEADRIVNAVNRHRVPFTMAWQMRVDPENLKMKEIVESDTIGRILLARRRHCLRTQQMPGFEESWHVRPELNRGMWADDAAHAVDFLLWMFGEPETVTAEIDTLVNPKVPDDTGVAVYRYANGLFAEVVSSFTATSGENTTEILGEKGIIIQNFGDQPSAAAPKPNGAIALKWFIDAENTWHYGNFEPCSQQVERIAGLAGPLADFICSQREALATAEEGRTALRMLLASYTSAAEGRRVRISVLS
jgi:predicted dehydrogenase